MTHQKHPQPPQDQETENLSSDEVDDNAKIYIEAHLLIKDLDNNIDIINKRDR